MTAKIIYLSLFIALFFGAVSETRAAKFNPRFDSAQFLKRNSFAPLPDTVKDTGDFKIGFAPEKGKKQQKIDKDLQKSF